MNRIAAGLSKHGVKQGDHVALLLGIQLEFPLSFFALMKLGAMVVPLNTRFKGEELAYEINDSESTLLIVDEEFWPQIGSVRRELKTVEKIFFNGTGTARRNPAFFSLEGPPRRCLSEGRFIRIGRCGDHVHFGYHRQTQGGCAPSAGYRLNGHAGERLHSV